MQSPTRARRCAAVVVVSVLLAAVPAHAGAAEGGEGRVRYAAPGATGGNGTEQAPWGDLDHALRSLEPGDTLLLRGGTYRQRLTRTIFTAATPGRPITVRAYPGERPVIQGLLEVRQADHWTFDGVNVTWDDATGRPDEPLLKLMNGVGWTFKNGEVSGARSYAGVYVGSTIAGEPRHWRLEGNCIRDTRAANPPFQDHNIYVQNGRGGPGVIERNVLFNAPNGNNIKLGAGPNDPGARDVTVRYNTLFNASQNLLIAYQASGTTFERNIVGRATGRDWYPNLRGYGNTGAGNVARDNVGWWADSFIRNTPADSGLEVAYGIVDGGNNRFGRDPRFNDATRCSGFVPADGAAKAYGHASPIDRVAGTGRVETAVALSQAAFPTVGGTRTVVVARADAYPDALAGAPLAAKLGGPVLLTTGDRLHSAAAAEIRRLGARTAVLLGGKAALSDRVIADLKAAGVRDVERLAGTDRYDTARRVAERLDADHAYVVEGANPDPGRGWPDAVAVSALAARTQRPILLVSRDRLPEPTGAALAALEPDHVEVVGGTAAVSAAVKAEVGEWAGEAEVTRVAGTSRYGTSLELARAAVTEGADPGRTWLATGRNWPDALAAGPAAAATGGLLLLVDGANLRGSAGTADWVRQHRGAIDRLPVVGGRGAVHPSVEDALAGLLR